jgi:hypothetical protein
MDCRWCSGFGSVRVWGVTIVCVCQPIGTQLSSVSWQEPDPDVADQIAAKRDATRHPGD